MGGLMRKLSYRPHKPIRLRLLALLCLCAGAPVSFGNTIPIEQFTAHGDYLDLSLSPDAKHMVARVQEGGTVAAVVLRREDNAVVGGFRTPKGDWIIRVDWASNERLVYSVAVKNGAFDSPVGTGELYAVDMDGSNSKIIFGMRNENRRWAHRSSASDAVKASHSILNTLTDDPDHILVLERPWERVGAYYYDRNNKKPTISRINIHTGDRRPLEVIPFAGASAVADQQGKVRLVSWLDAANKLHTATRADARSAWQELDLSRFQLESAFPIAVTSNGSKAYLTATRGAGSVRSAFEVDFASNSVAPLFDNSRYDIDHMILDGQSGVPAVGISWPGKPAYHYANQNLVREARHKQLAKAFPGQYVTITSADKEERYLLAHVSSATNPGEYYLFDTQKKSVDFVLANASWLDTRLLRPMVPVAITASDGLPIHGYLTLPKPAQTGKAAPPLVVLPHGGPKGVRDYWEYNPEVQLLANRGYAVLQVNFRSSSGYGEQFLEAGNRQWGGKVIDDILEMTEHVIAQGQADGDRVCVYGASFGGYAALMSAIRAPDRVRCAIGYVGIYDLERLPEEGDIASFIGGSAYLEQVLGSDSQELAQYSPTERAKEIKAAVMLIHGAKDLRAPISQAKRLRQALKKAGNDPEWLVFPRAGHGVWDEKGQVKLYTALLNFLNQHLMR